MSWARIEPHCATTAVDEGLAAAVADPLWFLLRQWQLGELTGDDGGTPVSLDVQASWSPFARFRASGSGPATTVDLAEDGEPVERLVERQNTLTPDDPARTPWAAAVRAGRALLDRVAEADPAAAERIRDYPAFAFISETTRPAEAAGPDDDLYRTLLTGSRTVDGVRVLAYLDQHGGLPPEVTGDSGADLAEVVARWRTAMDAEWGIGAVAAPDSWIGDRLEYSFALAAPPLPDGGTGVAESTGPVVLAGSEYDGSGVSWAQVDAVDPMPDWAADLTGGPGTGTRIVSLLPAPLSYPSMPADRFWEFEDRRVSLGRVGGGPTDLVKILAVDFATVFSPDWYLAPVEVPVGAVARVDWVVVRDTFGFATLAGTAAGEQTSRFGRQYRAEPDGGAGSAPSYIAVLPSVLASLTSAPSEDVCFQRDEGANLAWAVEQAVPGPSGRPVTRDWSLADFEPPPANSADAELVWRLSTPVPRSWTPLVATQPNDGRFLLPARMFDTATDELRSALGDLVAELRGRGIRDEEIPPEGIRVRVQDQLCRTPDGRTWVWRGRQKDLWRGEASSGLRFDDTTPNNRNS